TTVIDTARIITAACTTRLAITGDVARRYIPRDRLTSADTHDSPTGNGAAAILAATSGVIGASSAGAPTKISIPSGIRSAARFQSSGRSAASLVTGRSVSGTTSGTTPVAFAASICARSVRIRQASISI